MKEDYCNFKISKLLKEKGFDWSTLRSYDKDGKIKDILCPLFLSEDTAMPTIQAAMKWLRKVKKIIISIAPTQEIDCKHLSYVATIQRILNKYELRFEEELYENSYEEACESAIEYCLTNLI